MTSTHIASEFISQSVLRLNENTPRIEKCLNVLSEEEVWKRPNDSSNSIANLMLHLCGNMTQWIISSLSGKPDLRKRDLEFSARNTLPKDQLLGNLKTTVDEATQVISSLDEQGLLQLKSVQGFEYSGMGIIIHVVEHYSYHTGQIALLTKLMKNVDLEFYAGVDLLKKNKVT
jgi:uncharacterized damage-inducible protein DinB